MSFPHVPEVLAALDAARKLIVEQDQLTRTFEGQIEQERTRSADLAGQLAEARDALAKLGQRCQQLEQQVATMEAHPDVQAQRQAQQRAAAQAEAERLKARLAQLLPHLEGPK